MDKTGLPEISKIWPDSTCVISAWRKGQILLVAGSPVLSTTVRLFQPEKEYGTIFCCCSYDKQLLPAEFRFTVDAPYFLLETYRTETW